MRIGWCRASVLFVLLLVCSTAGHAQKLYVEGQDNVFGTLNPLTGIFTPIGTTAERIGGMGFGSDGNLYGVGDNTEFYRIDTNTAALTPIGPTGASVAGGYGMGATSDGAFYIDNGIQQLYSVDRTTGVATLVGNTGFSSNADPSGDGSGNLYATSGTFGNNIYSVDRGTGAGTLLGHAATNGGAAIFALAFSQGTMYATDSFDSIYAINLANGAATFTSNYNRADFGGEIYSATGAKAASSVVPESGSLALLVAGLAIPGARWLIRPRRR